MAHPLPIAKQAWRLYRTDDPVETYAAVALFVIVIVWIGWQTGAFRWLRREVFSSG